MPEIQLVTKIDVPEQIKSPTLTFSSDVVLAAVSGVLYPKPSIGNIQSAVIFPLSLSFQLDFQEAKQLQLSSSSQLVVLSH